MVNFGDEANGTTGLCGSSGVSVESGATWEMWAGELCATVGTTGAIVLKPGSVEYTTERSELNLWKYRKLSPNASKSNEFQQLTVAKCWRSSMMAQLIDNKLERQQFSRCHVREHCHSLDSLMNKKESLKVCLSHESVSLIYLGTRLDQHLVENVLVRALECLRK